MISKIKRIILASSFAFLALFCISCNNGVQNRKDNENKKELGSATLSIFVPDFNQIAESQTNAARVIAPQTEKIKFSYQYDDDETINFDPVALSTATATPIQNAETGVFGKIYKITFSGIYAGTYAAGSMKVELLDSEETTITSGVNDAEVVVTKGTTATAKFYTLPVSDDDDSASLTQGEMKFFKINLHADRIYKLNITVGAGQTLPDLVIFNENGTYNSYKTQIPVLFEKSDEDRVFYIGVYAKNAACTYNSSLIYIPEAIELASESIELDYDDTYQISYTVSPSGATVSSVTYSSSNNKIAVSANGTITASSDSDGLQQTTITVNVDGIEKTILVKVQKKVTSISLCNDIIVATTNGTATVHATVLPADATDPTVTWTIANSEIATVANGTISGLTEGITTVTAKAGNLTKTAKVIILQSDNDFTVTDADDLRTLTTSDSSTYAGYITDAAGKIAYKYTTAGHASRTGLNSGIGKWDIIGKKGNTWYSSTYVNAGWGWKINDTTVSLSSKGIATSGNLQLQVLPYLVYNKGVPFIMLVQLLTNTGSTDLTGQKFGSGTDVQIAGNDTAPVNASEFGANLIDYDKNMIFSLNCLSGDAITPVSTMWIGNYNAGAMANVYTNNRISCVDIDSAISYSWKDIDIAAGETKVFAVRLTFVEDEGGSLTGVIY